MPPTTQPLLLSPYSCCRAKTVNLLYYCSKSIRVLGGGDTQSSWNGKISNGTRFTRLATAIEVAKGSICNCDPNHPEEWDDTLCRDLAGYVSTNDQSLEIIPAPFYFKFPWESQKTTLGFGGCGTVGETG